LSSTFTNQVKVCQNNIWSYIHTSQNLIFEIRFFTGRFYMTWILCNDYGPPDIIYILFSIFCYRQKIYKDFDEKENDGINGNKEFIWYQQKRDLLI
jgi:hypothetical protein